jgi:hypothetical protein
MALGSTKVRRSEERKKRRTRRTTRKGSPQSQKSCVRCFMALRADLGQDESKRREGFLLVEILLEKVR